MQGAVGLPKYRALDANRLAYDGVTSTPFHPHPGLDPSHSPPDFSHVTPDVAVPANHCLALPSILGQSLPHTTLAYPTLTSATAKHTGINQVALNSLPLFLLRPTRPRSRRTLEGLHSALKAWDFFTPWIRRA